MQQQPTKLTWQSWGFLERLDWAARENSRQGPRLPNWILALTYGRFVFQNLCFLFIILVLPSSDLIGPRESTWQTFLRYTVWTYLLDSLGVRNGPMLDGRFTPWPFGMFSIARYRFMPGTLKLPRINCMGVKRTIVDVIVYGCFLVASVTVVFSTVRSSTTMAIITASVSWCFVSDHQQFLATQSTTYFYVILAGCCSVEHGGVACAQWHLILIWLGSGLGKIGPWFCFVNGPFLSASIWLRGRSWLWKWLYQGEDDLRPTRSALLLGHAAPHVEWFAPLLLCVVGNLVLIRLGVCMLLAMHLYILIAPAARDVYSWNGWFIVALICLFSSSASCGFDSSGLIKAPKFLIMVYTLETVVVAIGLFRPTLISYQTGHRNWAGNWSQSIILLRRSAADKMCKSITTFGRPPWDAIPPSLRLGPQPSESNIMLDGAVTYKLLGNYWLGTLNLKVIPSLVKLALEDEDLQEFYVLHGNQFCDMCMGSFFCLSWFPQVLNIVQKIVSFDERECLCIHVSSLSLQCGSLTKNAEWKILDACTGIIAKGEFNVDMAWMLAKLPSACGSFDSLLCGESFEESN